MTIRRADSIYKAQGDIENGTFSGRWHFSFGDYCDSEHTQFGRLRVFNDDTLSPGAVWPLHPHRNIEVVTYCAEGEFRHADEHGRGGVLLKGWVQHTSVGKGMWHSEINNRRDIRMRFIQMWFVPSRQNLKPSVEQRQVEKNDRTDRFLLLVSNEEGEGLRIFSEAKVYSRFLKKGAAAEHSLQNGWGGYLYVLEGGPVNLNDSAVDSLGAAVITNEERLAIAAKNDSEILLVETAL